LLPKAAHRGRGRTGAGEGVEERPDGALHGQVGVEHDMSRGIVDQAHRQAHLQLAPARLGQLAPDKPGPQHVQFSLAHSPLKPEQEPVVELGGVVDAVLVQDQGVGEGADLEQAVPVRRTAGQARHLQAEHHPDLAQTDGGHQALEALAVSVGPRLRNPGENEQRFRANPNTLPVHSEQASG
jgi:hypothetical protein